MKLNQKGIGGLESLLLLVIVGIIGFTGWYVWQSKQNTNKSLTANNSGYSAVKKKSVTKDTHSAVLTADWMVYKSSSIQYATSTTETSYTVKLPNGTAFISNPDSPSIYSHSQVKASTQKATVNKSSKASSSPIGIFIIPSANDSIHVAPSGDAQTSLTTDAGVNIKKYVDTQNSSLPTGAKSYQYILTKGDHALAITYNFLGDGNVYIVEAMVKTAVLQ